MRTSYRDIDGASAMVTVGVWTARAISAEGSGDGEGGVLRRKSGSVLKGLATVSLLSGAPD